MIIGCLHDHDNVKFLRVVFSQVYVYILYNFMAKYINLNAGRILRYFCYKVKSC